MLASFGSSSDDDEEDEEDELEPELELELDFSKLEAGASLIKLECSQRNHMVHIPTGRTSEQMMALACYAKCTQTPR